MASKGNELLASAALLSDRPLIVTGSLFCGFPAEQVGEGPKGSGKKKGKTVPLTDFLKPASMGNWADDDVEDSRECSFQRPALAL